MGKLFFALSFAWAFSASAAPVISNIQVSQVTESGATVSWTTNVAATGRVQYGLTASYGSYVRHGDYTTAHSLTIPGLSSDTTYSYQVKSADAAGGVSGSVNLTFRTLAPPPAISNLHVSSISVTSAVVSWNTNVPATGRVQFGLTTALASYVRHAELTTTHSLTLSGLTANTSYFYQAKSADALSRVAGSAVLAFRTGTGTTPPPGGSIKVMSYNIHGGEGTDGHSSWAASADEMFEQGADVVCANESTANLGTAITGRLRTRSGANWDSRTTAENTVFSKLRILDADGRELTAWGCERRYVQWVTVEVGTTPVRVYCTHIDTNFTKSSGPCNAVTSTTRVAELDEVMGFAASFNGHKVIAGDFNAAPGTSEYNALTSGGYVDSWNTALQLGTASAYPPCNPVGFTQTRTSRSRIDFIFANPSLRASSSSVPDTRDLTKTGVTKRVGNCDDDGVRPSDHNPVVTTFGF